MRHERSRGQRAVPTARGRRQGNVKRSFTASTASRTPRPSNRRAAAKFSAGGVESWQKSRPASRHRVESGAAEQRCYKGAFAPGLGRLGRAHDERSLGFVCVTGRTHRRYITLKARICDCPSKIVIEGLLAASLLISIHGRVPPMDTNEQRSCKEPFNHELGAQGGGGGEGI